MAARRLGRRYIQTASFPEYSRPRILPVQTDAEAAWSQ
jgi:hypothetical protein